MLQIVDLVLLLHIRGSRLRLRMAVIAERIAASRRVWLRPVYCVLPMGRISMQKVTRNIRPELLKERPGSAFRRDHQGSSYRAANAALILGQI